MKEWKAILVILLCLTTYAVAQCPENCDECDDSGSICFACRGDFEINVFGGCHPNTIDKCITYGPNDQCFRCQQAYSVLDGKCARSYTGCINEGGANECYECAFGMTLDGTSCKGVINCADFDGKNCKKCSDGYTLTAGICKDSSPGCADVRSNDGICNKCKADYFQSGYRCFEKKFKNDRCQVLADNQKCLYCKGGFNEVGGKCLLNKELSNPPSSGQSGSSGSSGFDSFGGAGSSDGSFGSSLTMTTSTTTTTSSFDSGSSSSFGSFDNGFDNGFGSSTGGSGFDSQPAAVIQNCQVPDPANGGCIICVYGWFPSHNKCEKVSQLCEGHNVQTGECFGCKKELTLEAGKCSDKKCTSWKVDKCQTCMKGFKQNQNGVCKQVDPNCVDSVNGKCQKCKPEFYIDISGKCKNLPPNCVTANMQTGACLECVKDYEILSAGAPCTKKIVIENCQVPDTKNVGKCAICNSGYFPEGNKCSKVSELCKDYNAQNGKCTSCISSGFNLNDGKCVDPNCAVRNGDLCAACAPKFDLNNAEKICKLVDPNCKNLAIASCLECKSGFYVSNDKTCKSLPQNCQSADQSGNCLSCFGGFEAYNGGCIKTIVIPNCAQVDSVNNKCLNCNDRFFFSGTGCAPVSPSCGTYNINNGWCLSCKQSNMVIQSDGSCAVPPPPPVAPSTLTVIPTNNQGNTQGNSQVNSQGNSQTNTQTNTQTFNQGTNIRSTAQGSDLNCREYSGTRCTRCSTRYYVNQQTNRCVPVNPLCRDSNSAGECTGCYQGYKVDSGKCIISQSNDANCKTPSGQQCGECYQGYFFSPADRICKRVNPLCKSSSSSGACTACYPGYALNSNNGNCEVSFKDPNCKDFKPDNTCRQCSSRYFVNSNGKCSAANPLCKDYNPNNGLCTGCYPGYGLTAEGQCQAGVSQDNNCKTPQGSSCRECVSGYFIGQDGKCKQASPLCKTFDRNNGNCLTCYSGYEVAQGACIVAKSTDPHCKKSDDQNQCLVCYSGYIAIRGKCLEQNPLCRGVDMSTGGCNGCWPGYVLDNSNCILEKSLPINSDPYCLKIENSVCTKCSNGYYYNRGQSSCAQLDPICKNSDMSNGDCTDCYSGYKLNNGKCTPADAIQIVNCLTVTNGQCTECIEGTYMSNGECKQVSILCASYNKDNGDCTSCISGHFLQDGACVFPAIFDQNCIRYDSAYCSKCRLGFYLSNFMCAPVDPNCSSFDYSTSTCQNCANGLFPNGSACQSNNY